MIMTMEYFTSSSSLNSNTFDSCKRQRLCNGDFKGKEFENESLMEFSNETSAKASSSSIHESIINMSNSHSTPEDNLSENALSSPFTKPHKAECDKDIDTSSEQYSKSRNGLIKSTLVSSINHASIDDTIESVLSKIREENSMGFSNSSIPSSSTASANSSKKSDKHMSFVSTIGNGVNNSDGMSRTFSNVSFHNTNIPSSRMDSGILNNNYSVSNLSKNHHSNYNYGNYYNNTPINLPNYNRPTVPKDSDKANIMFQQYQSQNMSYMPYMSNAYSNQPYYRQDSRAVPVQAFQNPVKVEPSYDHKMNSNETNQLEYGINFKAPQLSAHGIFDQSVRKRRPTIDQNKSMPSKKRKVVNHITPNNNYEDLVNKLKSTNTNALLMNPSFSKDESLLPPHEFSVSKTQKAIKYQKYKSSPHFIVKPKYFKDCHQIDKFLSNYVPETISGKVILSDKYVDGVDGVSDIICDSPLDYSQLSDNLLYQLEPSNILCDPSSPQLLTSPNLPISCDSRKPVSSARTYTQMSGSFLKRTKINGKSFSSVHIEETVSVASLVAARSQNSCQNCHMFLTGLSCIKRSQKSDLHSNEESIICSNCSSLEPGIISSNTNDIESTKVHIKTTPYKPSKNYKKVVDYEQYVRQRIPSNDEVKRPLLGVNYRYFSDIKSEPSCKETTVKEDVGVLLKRYSRVYRPPALTMDQRCCILCQGVGDDSEDVCGRLINLDSDSWIHLNCGLWCFDVFETVSGSLVGLQSAVTKASKTECTLCRDLGAGIQCYRSKCSAVYHVPCAHRTGCVFYTDRGMYCPAHAVLNHPMHLTTLKADRRVTVGRDECALVAEVVLADLSEERPKIRIGTLNVNEIGQLLPEQLASGHYNSSATVYPIGYHATRIYWSTTVPNQRCQYECHIDDSDAGDGPLFRVKYRDEGTGEETVVVDRCCDKLWNTILTQIAKVRHQDGLTRLFPAFLSGEQLYGLTEPHVVRIIESLPGVETIIGYAFKFGRMELISKMPLAINPSGSARTEPKSRSYVRRVHIDEPNKQSQCSVLKTKTANHHLWLPQELPLLAATSKIANSRVQQYKQLRSEWFNNVILSRSRIQGLGLFAATGLEKSTMIIEYIGETIRNEVGNRREQLYQSRNNSIYMFRLSDDLIIDATVRGGLARYINHSCAPNCQAEFVSLDSVGGGRIVISTKQRIERGEELTYDYKFDFEDDSSADKIPCLCGAINCRGWMN